MYISKVSLVNYRSVMTVPIAALQWYRFSAIVKIIIRIYSNVHS